MVHQNGVGEETRSERQRDEHQNRGPAGQPKRLPRKEKLRQNGYGGRSRNGRNDPARAYAGRPFPRSGAQPAVLAAGIEEQRGDLEIKFGIKPEDQTDHRRNPKRNQSAVAIHRRSRSSGSCTIGSDPDCPTSHHSGRSRCDLPQFS